MIRARKISHPLPVEGRESRRHIRVEICLPLVLDSEKNNLHAETWEISIGGMVFLHPRKFERLQHISGYFRIFETRHSASEGHEKNIKFSGRILRSDPWLEPGLGNVNKIAVQFEKMDDAPKNALEDFINYFVVNKMADMD